eukprot:972891-Rhodomonas_salina.2
MPNEVGLPTRLDKKKRWGTETRKRKKRARRRSQVEGGGADLSLSSVDGCARLHHGFQTHLARDLQRRTCVRRTLTLPARHVERVPGDDALAAGSQADLGLLVVVGLVVEHVELSLSSSKIAVSTATSPSQ